MQYPERRICAWAVSPAFLAALRGLVGSMAATEPQKHEEPRHRDKRVAKTRLAITTAFWELLAEHELARVTISGIARCAGIDRKTFYLHYRSVDDLVAALVDELVGAMYDEYERRPGYHRVEALAGRELAPAELAFEVRTFYEAVASVIERTDAHCRLLVRRVPPATLYARLYEAVTEEIQVRGPLSLLELEERDLRAATSYVLGGALSLFAPWLYGETSLSLRTLAQQVAELTSEGVAGLAKRGRR